MAANKPLPALCLAGPTGSGKTELALLIAEEFNCEIVNADSRQLYADFPIITAQPGEGEKSRVCHHLYGLLGLTEKSSAGQWAEKAYAACRAIHARNKLPLLVGGTGFYFTAMLQGLAKIPQIPAAISASWARKIDAYGSSPLHKELCLIDPEYGAQIHPHDKQRIQRALEVFEATGRTFSWWHKHAMEQPKIIGPLLLLDASLDWLTPLLEQRIELMLAQGAVSEAEKALAKCADADAPGWSGIGCLELYAYLTGRIGLNECRKLWLANTRAYAKRQLTWFHGRKNAIKITPGSFKEARQAIKKFASHATARSHLKNGF